jgi:isoamylase
MDHRSIEFTLPEPAAGRGWHRVIDTAAWAESEGNYWASTRQETMDARYVVHGYAVAVFTERASV